MMKSVGTSVDPFDAFVRQVEPRLRDALSAALGTEPGRDATAEALIYPWQHWSKVQAMTNPVGYLYVIGRNCGRKWHRRRQVVLMPVDSQHTPWVEPHLPLALNGLSDQQRMVVMLLYCFEWTMSEVAELLGVSKSTVQSHAERGLTGLRSEMGASHAR